MESLSSLPRDWASLALARAREQECLPESPAKVVDSEILLCAAACIAYAGLKLKRPGAEKVLCSSLLKRSDKTLVVDAFAELGLSSTTCFYTMSINDETEPEHRLGVLKKAAYAMAAPPAE